MNDNLDFSKMYNKVKDLENWTNIKVDYIEKAIYIIPR